jgi:hypothetical protein
LLWTTAQASPATTRDSLDRLEEVLQLRMDDGRLSKEAVLPAILVSAEPRYEASVDWYTVRVLEVLTRSFGDSGLRLCEACMAPRTYAQGGSLTYQAGPVSLADVMRLDAQTRGTSQPARSAIWLDEHRGGVAIRIVDLASGGVIFAQNVDPNLVEYANTQRMYNLTAELERRAKGRSLTQAFVDVAVYPGQHVSLDWTDQWGKRNGNMAGLTVSLFDPVAGIGGCYYGRIPLANVLVGGKVLLSMPTALVRSVADADTDVLDPLLNVVGVARLPFGRSNYGVVLTASTNGQVGLGISLMNISLLPVIP